MFVMVLGSPLGVVVFAELRCSVRASDFTSSREAGLLPSGRCVGLGTPAGDLVAACPPFAGSGAAGTAVVWPDAKVVQVSSAAARAVVIDDVFRAFKAVSGWWRGARCGLEKQVTNRRRIAGVRPWRRPA